MQTWSPKDLTMALRDFPAVNLKHLTTRLNKNFIRPCIASAGKGSKNIYDATNSLKYALSVMLEDIGLPLEEAAFHANIVIEANFFHRDYLWLLYFYGITPGSSRSCVWHMHTSDNIPQKVRDTGLEFVSLNPMPDVFFTIRKDEFEKTRTALGGKITANRFIDLSSMIADCVNRLDITDKEIEMLNYHSQQIFLKQN